MNPISIIPNFNSLPYPIENGSKKVDLDNPETFNCLKLAADRGCPQSQFDVAFVMRMEKAAKKTYKKHSNINCLQLIAQFIYKMMQQLTDITFIHMCSLGTI